MMRALIVSVAAGFCLAACETAPPAPDTAMNAAPAPDFSAAIADPGRPGEDVARDGDRKPAAMLAFAEIAPGQKVGELLPGRGYFTRIFSKAVGPGGHVYAVAPQLPVGPKPEPGKLTPIQALAADPAYGNITVLDQAFTAIAPPVPLDVVWTSQNYHDLHLPQLKTDVVAVNKAIYNALKPGGLYIVLDHAAAPGAPVSVAETLHRIDPAIVKQEAIAAGFAFVSESEALRLPADDHTLNVFAPAIRGKTDQFIYKFRKPG